jgi:hypothetical protein
MAEEFEGSGQNKTERPIIENGEMISICDDKEKAELFADHCSGAHMPSREMDVELEKIRKEMDTEFRKLPAARRDEGERCPVVNTQLNQMMKTRGGMKIWKQIMAMTHWMN